MRCDLYARKSNDDAGKSAARQERDWQRDCANEGYEPGRVFIDPDLSASLFAKKSRPDFDRLVEHIKSGHCQIVGMWEASRGSRTASEWMAFLELCRAHGTLIRVFSEGNEQTFDMARPRDWRALADEGLDAHAEALTLSRRSKNGHRDAAHEGKPPSPLLYGYARLYDEHDGTRQWVPHPEHSPVVRRLADDTFAGVPLHAQARRLNEAGVPTPSGNGRWTSFQIRRLLLNPGLAGHRVHLGKIAKKSAWRGIITDEEHQRLVALLKAPDRSERRRRNYADTALTHQLSGAALCGVCGHVLRTERATRYVCKWRGCGKVSARITDVDQVVDAMVIAWLRQDDAAGIFAPDVDDEAVQATRRELRELRDYLDNFLDEAAEKMLSAEAVSRVENRTRPKIDKLEARLRELTTPPALRALDGVDVVGEWSSLPVGVHREVILHIAEIRLSPVGRAGRWSQWRLAESRYRGDSMTWGDRWREAGLMTENA